MTFGLKCVISQRFWQPIHIRTILLNQTITGRPIGFSDLPFAAGDIGHNSLYAKMHFCVISRRATLMGHAFLKTAESGFNGSDHHESGRGFDQPASSDAV